MDYGEAGAAPADRTVLMRAAAEQLDSDAADREVERLMRNAAPLPANRVAMDRGGTTGPAHVSPVSPGTSVPVSRSCLCHSSDDNPAKGPQVRASG